MRLLNDQWFLIYVILQYMTHSILVLSIQSMIVTPSIKSNVIKEKTCSLYPGGFLFGFNIITASIIFYLDFM